MKAWGPRAAACPDHKLERDEYMSTLHGDGQLGATNLPNVMDGMWATRWQHVSSLAKMPCPWLWSALADADKIRQTMIHALKWSEDFGKFRANICTPRSGLWWPLLIQFGEGLRFITHLAKSQPQIDTSTHVAYVIYQNSENALDSCAACIEIS